MNHHAFRGRARVIDGHDTLLDARSRRTHGLEDDVSVTRISKAVPYSVCLFTTFNIELRKEERTFFYKGNV
jgi:hypothetical protein